MKKSEIGLYPAGDK